MKVFPKCTWYTNLGNFAPFILLGFALLPLLLYFFTSYKFCFALRLFILYIRHDVCVFVRAICCTDHVLEPPNFDGNENRWKRIFFVLFVFVLFFEACMDKFAHTYMQTYVSVDVYIRILLKIHGTIFSCNS